MIALLLLALAARDEAADLIAKLRAASDVNQRYQITNQLTAALKPTHVPLLVKEAETGPTPVRVILIRELARFRTKDAVAALKSLSQKYDLVSRAEAAGQLRWLDDETGLPLLLALLPKAQTPEEKRAILNGLFGGFNAEGGADIVRAIAKFMEQEKAEELRREALQILGYQKDPSAFLVLKKISTDPYDVLKFEALGQLIRRGDDDALAQGLKSLENETVPTQGVFHLLNAIENSGKRTVLPRLRELLEKSTDRSLRTALVSTLASMKDDKSIPLLSKLSEDADASISRAALDGIIKMAGKGQLELLRKVATEGDSVKRLEAAAALLQLDLREGYDGVKAELAGDKTYYRVAAVMALGKVRRKESVDLLLPLLDDAEENVRRQARTAIQSALSALFPYLKFDANAGADKIRAWWEKNRPK